MALYSVFTMTLLVLFMILLFQLRELRLSEDK